MGLDRPIPAFYCCYLLRSTVSRGSVYVGSTPNPVRRLRQHNGDAKGGAVRTNRPSLRPWEMSCIVMGFPSHVAALQFEWAWQNPHTTTHIPAESRIQHATQKKRSGHPKRPRHSVASLLSNLHLLLRVPTFSRWPLELRFFAPDVHKAWLKWTKTTPDSIRQSLNIIEDFPLPTLETLSDGKGSPRTKSRKVTHGIQGLEVGYAKEKFHVEKAKNIVDFEREGNCTICHEDLEHDKGVYAICPTAGCESITHLTCLSQHFQDDDEALVPISGTCPQCETSMQWIDVVKETTLRIRGQKQISELLKVKRVRKEKVLTASQKSAEPWSSEDEMSEEEELADLKPQLRDLREADEDEAASQHLERYDSDSDAGSSRSNVSKVSKKKSTKKTTKIKAIIEDSDGDDVEVW